MDIQNLREETEADHLNVESAVPLMHQGLNVVEYVQCLQRIYGVVAAWEERAAEIGPEWLQSALIEGGEEVPVYGALGQISQVMANLISNAIQAVPVGGQIRLSAREDDGMTEIRVQDNGHGMNDEVLRHLFEPFYSTKGDLGNGLGLTSQMRLWSVTAET